MWLLLQEFIQVLSDLSYGTVDDKLRWTFDLYDQDGDGIISREEMESLVTSIYEMMGYNTEPAVDPVLIQTRVNSIMSQVFVQSTDSHYHRRPFKFMIFSSLL